MNQVWHIFRKDTRHFWREIVVLFALLIMYAWNEMRSWSHPGSRAYGMGSIWGISNELPGLVGVLIPVIWLFLVIRIVHDEPLVGDRQFWVTRPYDWRALLAEKVLFSVAFINIPLFFLQVFLLTAASFAPHNHLAGLLAAQIGIFMIAIFSTVFLSSITRTIPQFLFGIVAVIVYLIGASYINSKIPNSSFAGPIDAVQGGLVLLTLLAVIIIQYARRRLALARLLLAGLAAILIIIAAVAPYRSFIDKEYPQRQSAELKLNLLAPKKVDENQDAGSPPGGEAKVVIFSLPVSTSEMAADSILKLQGQMISIDSQSGVHWTSNWTRSGIQLFPEQKRFPLGFVLDHHVFEQIKNSPVKLTVSLLYETYVDDSRRNLTIPEGRFTITEIGGPCEPVPYSWRNLVCLAPLLRRVNLLLTTDLSASTCPLHEKETPAAPGTIARHWEHRQSEAPEFGISPTQPVNLYLAQMNWDPAQQHIGGGLCPGTQVVLSHPRFLYQAQQSMSFENVDLSKYMYGRGTRAELRAITQ